MSISWWTLALQAINFLVLVWLLQHFLYKPVLAVIAKRKQLVEEAFTDAATAKDAAAVEQQKYEEGQRQLTQARQELLRKTHAELDAERVRVLEAARKEAAALLDGARTQLDAERRAALADLRTQIAEVAMTMATGVLQQVTTAAAAQALLHDGLLAEVSSQLQQLPAGEKAALQRELASADSGMSVVTAVALDAAQQQRWRRMLEERLNFAGEPQFVVEPALVGGAELRFPHAVLSFAWSELLRQGKDALLADETAR